MLRGVIEGDAFRNGAGSIDGTNIKKVSIKPCSDAAKLVPGRECLNYPNNRGGLERVKGIEPSS